MRNRNMLTVRQKHKMDEQKGNERKKEKKT